MHSGIVAIPADIRSFDGYTWHASPDQYIMAAVNGSNVLPLIVPALSDGADVDMVLDRVDGVLISGSRTNVHPSNYGEEETESHGPFDPARDRLSMALIRRAIERGVPLLAICRGIQELNVALGGSLATEIQELPGRLDHRKPETEDRDVAFAIRHSIEVKEGSCLAAIVGGGQVQVNSLHRQAISKTGAAARSRGSRRRRNRRGRQRHRCAGLCHRRAMASRILGWQRRNLRQDLRGLRRSRQGAACPPCAGGRIDIRRACTCRASDKSPLRRASCRGLRIRAPA